MYRTITIDFFGVNVKTKTELINWAFALNLQNKKKTDLFFEVQKRGAAWMRVWDEGKDLCGGSQVRKEKNGKYTGQICMLQERENKEWKNIKIADFAC